MTSRRYEQRLRAETAEETRRRILDAVYERLRAAPTERLSLDQVAQSARVARSTIYLIFGSRGGVFAAVASDLLDRGGFDRVVKAVSHPDPRETIRLGLLASCEVFAKSRDIYRVLLSSAMLDPDATAGATQRSEKERAAGMKALATRLGEQGQLRADVSIDEAAHVLWLMTGFDAFDSLYTGRGLPVEEVARLLTATAERTLCRPRRGSGRTAGGRA